MTTCAGRESTESHRIATPPRYDSAESGCWWIAGATSETKSNKSDKLRKFPKRAGLVIRVKRGSNRSLSAAAHDGALLGDWWVLVPKWLQPTCS